MSQVLISPVIARLQLHEKDVSKNNSSIASISIQNSIILLQVLLFSKAKGDPVQILSFNKLT